MPNDTTETSHAPETVLRGETSETPTGDVSPVGDAAVPRPTSLSHRARALLSRVPHHRVPSETVQLQRLRDEAERQDELSRASSQAVALRRRASRAAAAGETETETLAVPPRLRQLGAWGTAVMGALQVPAPLLVSGYFTMQVGMDDPLKMGFGIALAFTLSLEGSVWYLTRLREQFRLEGDSTLGLNAAIGLIIALISALIGGHAIWAATGRVPLLVDLPFTELAVPLSELTPAVAVALMCAIGAYVAGRRATFKHRVKLRLQQKIDPASPRFAAARWMVCFYETFWSNRHAIKYSISSPTVAVADWRLWRASGRPAIWPALGTEPETDEVPETLTVPAPVVPSEPSRPAFRPVSRSVVPQGRPETGEVRDDGRDALLREVGRLRSGTSRWPYEKIGEALGMSKSEAHRLGQQAEKLHYIDLDADPVPQQGYQPPAGLVSTL